MFFQNNKSVRGSKRANLILAALAATTLSSHMLDASTDGLDINTGAPTSLSISYSYTGSLPSPYGMLSYAPTVDALGGDKEFMGSWNDGLAKYVNAMVDIFEVPGPVTRIEAFAVDWTGFSDLETLSINIDNINWGGTPGYIDDVFLIGSLTGTDTYSWTSDSVTFNFDFDNGFNQDPHYITLDLDVKHQLLPPPQVPVPEPSTYMLLGTMAGISMLRKNKVRKPVELS